jgi:hypothetical protein
MTRSNAVTTEWPRAKHLRRPWLPLPLQPYLSWLKVLGTPGAPRIMPVLGPSRAHRGTTYSNITNALTAHEDVILEAFANDQVLDSIFANTDVAFGPYGLAWELAVTKSLSVECPLRDLVDEDGLLHDAFRLIWEMRFLLQEQPDGRAALAWLRTFQSWRGAAPLGSDDQDRLNQAHVRSRPSTFDERLAIFNLVLSLAFQNNVCDHMLVILDGVDAPSAPRDAILNIARAFDDWGAYARLPIGFLAGLDLNNLPAMRRAHPQFAGVVLG